MKPIARTFTALIFLSLFNTLHLYSAQLKKQQKQPYTDSINRENECKRLYKSWLMDTIAVINKNKGKVFEPGLKNRCIRVYEDSLFSEFRYNISKVIYPNTPFSDNTIIGTALYHLKVEHVNLPQKPFEIRIAYTEFYECSYRFMPYERSYEYSYLSVRPLDSNIETHYSIIKGNLVGTEKKRKTTNWLPQYWDEDCY